jgi:hypothetical protein
MHNVACLPLPRLNRQVWCCTLVGMPDATAMAAYKWMYRMQVPVHEQLLVSLLPLQLGAVSASMCNVKVFKALCSC